MNPKLVGAALLAVLALAVLLLILVLPSPPQPAAPAATATVPAPVPAPATTFIDGSPAVAPGPAAPVPGGAFVSEDVWAARLDTLLSSDEDNAITARKLVAALPDLPPEAQEEYVSHAVNLLEDEDFAQLESVYLSAGTPPDVIETIFNDALNRSDEIKLPLLVKTVRNPAHPMAGEAKEILEMYLDIDPDSTAPVAWEQEVQRYLREEAENQP